MAGIYFSDLSGKLDDSQPPSYESLFGRQSASSREQENTPSNTDQRACDSLYGRQSALYSEQENITSQSNQGVHDTLYGRQPATHRERENPTSPTHQRDQSIQDEARQANRKTKCYVIVFVFLSFVSIAAIGLALQKAFKHEDDVEKTSADDVQLSPTKPFPECSSTASSPYHFPTIPSTDHLTGSWGTRFIVLFMKNIMNTKKTIYVTTVNEVNIKVTTSERLNSSLKIEIDQTANIYSFKQFIIPRSMELESFKTETKCILIETSENTMVVSQADVYSSVGMTTHIPIHKLSTKYVIASTNPVKYFSQFALASIDENTMVWITFRMKEALLIDGKIYQSGETFSIKLNRYETYQIQHTVDMTGTVIESSSPIAVFSGNDCNKLNGQGFCDHLIEQLPPTSRIDTVYVVPPHLYSNTKIRVIAIDKSSIFYNCTNKTNNKSYERTEYFDIDISINGLCYIQSNKPILVASFGLSSSITNMGDPSMVIVPGIHQYQNYYKIIVPVGYEYSYITVIMGQCDSLLLINGYTVKPRNILYQEIVYNNFHFRVMIIRVFAGELTVTTTKNEKFGLMCAGMKYFQSYAFSGNSVL